MLAFLRSMLPFGRKRAAERAPVARLLAQREADARQQTPVMPDMERLGIAGTKVSWGRIFDKEKNPDLKRDKWPPVVEEMRRTDPVLMAMERSLINTQLTARWRFAIPDDAQPLQREARDFLNANFGFGGARGRLKSGWEGFLNQALLYQIHGYRYFEECYAIEGSKVWVDLADCEPSAHWRWTVDETGELLEIGQFPQWGDIGTPAPGTYGYTIPANKVLLLTHARTGANYEGVGLFRPCWFPWRLKAHTLDQISVGVERWAVPTPIIKSDMRVLTEQQGFAGETVAQMVTNAKTTAENYLSHESAYLATVEGITFDTYGGANFDGRGPIEVVAEMDRQMLTTTGLQFLLLGVNDTGSRAVGEVQSTFFRRLAVNGLDYLAAQIGATPGPGRGTIGRLMRWNFPALPESDWPRMEHEGLDISPLAEFAALLPGLKGAGFIRPDNATEAALRNFMRVAPLAAEEERSPDERAAAGNPIGAAAAMFSERRRRQDA